MKTIRTLSAVFALASLLVATACAGNKEKANSPNAANTENEAKVTALTQADFIKQVYNYEANPKEWKFEGSRPAIIDFYATWCGPCKVIAPILEDLAKEYAGKIDVYKVDVDKEPELATTFGITGIPALLMIPMKGEPKMQQGLMTKEQLEKLIQEFLLVKK